jgi:hypothetical protein
MTFRITHYDDIFNQPWSHHSETVALYMRLLHEAAYKSAWVSGVKLEEGQVLFGYREWEEKTGISLQSVRTSINRLKSTHHLTIKSTRSGSVVTLCYYKEKQQMSYDHQHTNQHTNQHTANTQLTHHQHTTNTNLDIRNTTYTTDTTITDNTNVLSKRDDDFLIQSLPVDKPVSKKKPLPKEPMPTPPDYVDVSLWNGYLEMRTANRIKTTPHAANLLLGKLKEFHGKGYSIADVMTEATVKGWKSFYEPKPQQNQSQGNNHGRQSNHYTNKADSFADAAERIRAAYRYDPATEQSESP